MKKNLLVLAVMLIFTPFLMAQGHLQNTAQKPVSASWIRENITTNPVTPSWIKNNLKKKPPRVILTETVEKELKERIKTDPLIGAYIKYLRRYANGLLSEPVLRREKTGRRLLGVSREAVRRMGILALLYRLEHNEKYLQRLTRELEAVSGFSDWNPSHFLDVAEMSYAVAIGLDWAGQWLPDSTVRHARSALKRHIELSFEDQDYNWWIDAHHNWNQVCHGGLSAAALVLADEKPGLAARVISRAVDKFPLAMAAYSPDGAYPEGPTYWDYGTSYNLLALSMYESALGTDFNLSKAPGFMESGIYRMVAVAPTGQSFNYSDAGYGSLDPGALDNLSWFAQKTGNRMFLDKEQFISSIQQEMNDRQPPPRLSPAALIWIVRFEEKQTDSLPVYWKAGGRNPIAIFRAEEGENTGFYLGVKGGSASVNHGNMDAGSFIFELNGVRWSVDPGNQNYNDLEQTIGSSNLWDQSQNSQRWSLLTKGNQFHSTLTVNGRRHNVEGFAPIEEFRVNTDPKRVSVNLSEIFKGQLKGAVRRFSKIDSRTLRIEDEITPAGQTESVTWAMMTQAEVTTTEQGAILRQDNQELHLNVIKPANLNVSVVSLDPPPLPYDKKIEGLKRIEITIPGYMLDQDKEEIIVELTSAEWEPLFNGKNFDSWHKLPGGEWTIKDGTIIGTSSKEEERHGLLVTDKVYSDFTVRLKYKIKQGDSGFYFRAEKVDEPVGVHGFQVEIDTNNESGGLYETGGRQWVIQPGTE